MTNSERFNVVHDGEVFKVSTPRPTGDDDYDELLGEYLHIDVADKGTVIIKNEDEGIVVDIYPIGGTDEPAATTWAHMSDLMPEDDD